MKAFPPQFFRELTFTTALGRGPGGQSVNRTESAVILRWNVWETEAFPMEKKLRLMEKLGPRLTGEGDLIVRSDSARSQFDNKNACIEKLEDIVAAALHQAKKRKPTRPSRSAKAKRIKLKKQRGEIKKLRKKDW